MTDVLSTYCWECLWNNFENRDREDKKI